MHDPILEEVWRARERLLKQYGGIDGLIKHVQAMDRARARKAKLRRAKHNGKRAAKNSRSSVRARAGTKTLSRAKTRSR
jgi:hypothetical protein